MMSSRWSRGGTTILRGGRGWAGTALRRHTTQATERVLVGQVCGAVTGLALAGGSLLVALYDADTSLQIRKSLFSLVQRKQNDVPVPQALSPVTTAMPSLGQYPAGAWIGVGTSARVAEMACAVERGDADFIVDDEAGWGADGRVADACYADEPNMPAPNNITSTEKKDKVVNLEQEMLKRRKIIIFGAIDDRVAYNVCMKILYLESEDPGKPIEILINSPGGKVAAGLAIYDWMQLVSSPIHTVCWGRAYSMGAVLLAAGEKGHRLILPNAKVMIHQPSLEIPRSVATDIMIRSKEMQDTKDQLKSILAKHMEKKEEWVAEASERDFYMKPSEAIECGIVDRIATELLHSKL